MRAGYACGVFMVRARVSVNPVMFARGVFSAHRFGVLAFFIRVYKEGTSAVRSKKNPSKLVRVS